MRVLGIILIFLSALHGSAQTSDHNKTVSDALAKLPLLPDGTVWAGQFSSHSPHQQNGDSGHFLYTDEHGDAVIFDGTGAGCIRSMWGTVLDSAAILRFYFDGEKKPRYEMNSIDFYRGRFSLFPAPLVSYERRGYYIHDSYAGNSFVPILFNKSLKITVKGKPTFYHILYEKYTENSRIVDSAGHRNFISAAFHTSGRNVWGAQRLKGQEQTSTLDPWKEVDLFRYSGSGSVRSVEIEVDSSANLLQNVYIQMIWDDANANKGAEDGQKKLAYEKNEDSRLFHVMAPLGMFFVSPNRVSDVRSLPFSVQRLENGRVRMTCNFVMPFWRNARISLFNRSGSSFKGITSSVKYDTEPYPENRTGYFTTFYRQGITEYGRDWLFCESPGTGWFLGAVQSCRLGHYCEGNEHFYMDGNRTPQINGTGTEDYYLGCFWPSLKYTSPFAGSVNDVRVLSGGDPNAFLTLFKEDYEVPAVYYRFHMEMPIPFYSSVDARIQHGSESQIASEYSSLAYLYLRRRPVLVETDLLDVGNESSMKAHSYRTKDKVEAKSLTARYEGDYLYTSIHDKGFYHGGGEITFNASIDPLNSGVRIRRRMDQSFARQKARVYVDGKFAGIWYDPQSNDILRWYDSEFNIPSALTRNKKSLRLKLVLEEGNHSFSDFEYRIFSLVLDNK